MGNLTGILITSKFTARRERTTQLTTYRSRIVTCRLDKETLVTTSIEVVRHRYGAKSTGDIVAAVATSYRAGKNRLVEANKQNACSCSRAFLAREYPKTGAAAHRNRMCSLAGERDTLTLPLDHNGDQHVKCKEE